MEAPEMDSTDEDFVVVGRNGRKQHSNSAKGKNNSASAAVKEENGYNNHHRSYRRIRRYRGGGSSQNAKRPPPGSGSGTDPPGNRRGVNGISLQQSKKEGGSGVTLKDFVDLKIKISDENSTSESSSTASASGSGPPIDGGDGNGMLSGDSSSSSLSSSAEVEVVVTPAPPPKVNPWRANPNAAQVITSKVTVAPTTNTATEPGPAPTPTLTNQPQPHKPNPKAMQKGNKNMANSKVPVAPAKKKVEDPNANVNGKSSVSLPNDLSKPIKHVAQASSAPKQWKAIPNQQQIQAAAASVDWPALKEATGKETLSPSSSKTPLQNGDVDNEKVQFTSNTTMTDSTDPTDRPTSSDDLIPPPKTQDEQASGSNEEIDHNSIGGTVQIEKQTKGKRGSKQKWLPLVIPSSEHATSSGESSKPRGRLVHTPRSHGRSRGQHREGVNRGTVAAGLGTAAIVPSNGIRVNLNVTGGRGVGQRGGPNTEEGTFPVFDSEFTKVVSVYTDLPYVWNGYGDIPNSNTVLKPSTVLKDVQRVGVYSPPPVDPVIATEMVKKQIEYYFSEKNLSKDFYLRQKMDEKGFVPVELIAAFPRVKTMTQDYNIVLKAIESSPKLELNEPEKTCVRAHKVECSMLIKLRQHVREKDCVMNGRRHRRNGMKNKTLLRNQHPPTQDNK